MSADFELRFVRRHEVNPDDPTWAIEVTKLQQRHWLVDGREPDWSGWSEWHDVPLVTEASE